ncbi:MAG: flagellar basal body rod protein FlgB [Alphaproteobacteria bacterium]|nr:flagellar basal body rod protein FlgB [Alphaproteobacteria bacterium]NCQ87602.1 flagellar basal body rod protein FlgB [Alphaproteobacteria bacterium]NCT06471.1 flagellar basal body rod protein FlgB [Alphaproteobacteria bacterium]
MTLQNIPLFQAMGAKMSYLDTKQGVIAQNIANADTPDYRAHELTKVDFGSMLREVSGRYNVKMEATAPGHLSSNNDPANPRNLKSRMTYEVAPAGNSVIIEEQMVNATKNTMDYNLVTNLMRKNVSMYMTALGKQQ